MIPCTASFFHSFVPSVTWSIQGDHICLTFDDGPHPTATPAVLDVLEEYAVKATFFLLGKNVARYPELAQELIQKGHAVGNHSFDHSLLLLRSASDILNQISRTTEQISAATSLTPTLFRPPYGYFRPTLIKLLHETGYKLVMWTVDARDWKPQPVTAIARRVIRRANHGSIVLLHDNAITSTTIHDVVKEVLDALLSQYRFLPLSP